MTVRMIGRVAYLVADDVPQCTYTLTPDVYRGLSQNVCRPNRYSEPTNIESMSEGNRGAAPETIVHRFREGMRFSLRNTLQQIGTRYTYVRGTSKGPTKSTWYIHSHTFSPTITGRSPMWGLRQLCCRDSG